MSSDPNPYQSPRELDEANPAAKLSEATLYWPRWGAHCTVAGWVGMGLAAGLVIFAEALSRFVPGTISSFGLFQIAGVLILALSLLLHATAGICWAASPDSLRYWGAAIVAAGALAVTAAVTSALRASELWAVVGWAWFAAAYIAQAAALMAAALRIGYRVLAACCCGAVLAWLLIAACAAAEALRQAGLASPPTGNLYFATIVFGSVATVIASMILATLVRRALLDYVPEGDGPAAS